MDGIPLVGTWRLVSFEVEDADSRVERPFGPDPVGFITYTEDGRVQVQFARADRPVATGGDWLAADEAAVVAAARDYFAYCGTYAYHDGEVVHRIELSLIPDWIGSEQVRRVVLKGDTAILTTPPTPVGGRQQRATLVWRRA